MLKRLTITLTLLWLIQIVILGLIWSFLPNSLVSSLLIALVAINGVLLYIRQLELPIFSSVALLLVLTHFWLGNDYISPFLASLFVFIGTAMIGLGSAGSISRASQDEILIWPLVGLFTAQITTLTQFWPITYFQKSMLGTIIFYLIWQSWRILSESTPTSTPVDAEDNNPVRRPFLYHFIFVSLTVMVVIANIIWTTWPGLKTF